MEDRALSFEERDEAAGLGLTLLNGILKQT